MNDSTASRELIVYRCLCAIAEKLSDDQLHKMLTRVSKTVEGIQTTSLYQRVLEDLQSGAYPMSPHLEKLLEDLQAEHPAIDTTCILWLIGLRCAATMVDDPAHCIQIQLMLFIASQRSGFYRIADDKLRLLTTYTYLQTTSSVLFKDEE
jgi:hypothetical protein